MKWECFLMLGVIGTLSLSAGAAVGAENKLPQRSEIAAEYKWRLEDIYATDEAWEADFKLLEGMQDRMPAFKGRLGSSGEVLLQALTTSGEIGKLQGRLLVYASMRNDEDGRVSKYAAMRDRMTRLSTRLGEADSYFEPEVLAIPEATLAGFYKAVPGLELYRHHLDNIQRGKPHTLAPEQERLLAMMGEFSRAPGDIFGEFNDTDLKFGSIEDASGKQVTITRGRYGRFLESPDRRVRRDAWKTLYRGYRDYNHMLAATMSANVNRDIFHARARGYDGSLHAALTPNNIPVAVYENLVSTVNAGLPALHRYAALRKKWLGLDTLRVYDLYVSLVPQASFEVPYDQAKRDVLAGLKPMGKEYLEAFATGLNSGWIDVYETEAKRGGAYSWGSYTTHPYMLLNHNNNLESEFTLAHEMGHSLHSWFTRKTQPYIYGNYATFVAEVASTTNEAVLINYLLQQEKDPTRRLYLVNFYLEQIRTTFFRQTLFAEFEMRSHAMAEKGEALTADALNNLYRELQQKYYGPDLVQDEEAAVEWSRIPHFYNSFYVYQYATSYAAATAFSHKILTDGDKAVAPYLGFLKSGSSDYPIEVLRKAGVDMATPAPIQATLDKFNELLNEMERLMPGKK